MAGKSDKDKQKALQDKHQDILNELLKEESNKYCVDCNCKGPRWASWNLGVFLCIRCAGIHRNLGVHVSRVKSVNLDSWTIEQIAMMQEIGNSFAKSIYEAGLPENFKVPQTDSALEGLIRAKYEQKKYMVKGITSPQPKIQSTIVVETVKKEKKDRKKFAPSRKLSDAERLKTRSAEISPVIERKNKKGEEKKVPPLLTSPPPPPPEVELLTLDVSESKVTTTTDTTLNDFLPIDDHMTSVVSDHVTIGNDHLLSNDLADLCILDPTSVPDQTKLANDAILALYGPANSSIVYGIPGGCYMPKQTPATFNGIIGGGGPSSSHGFVNAIVIPQQPVRPVVSGTSLNVPVMGQHSSSSPSMLQCYNDDHLKATGTTTTATTTSSSSSISNGWMQPTTRSSSSSGRTLCTSLWK